VRVVHVVLMAALCTFNLQAQSPGGGRSGSVKTGTSATQRAASSAQQATTGQKAEPKKQKAKKVPPPFQWVNPLPKAHAVGLRQETFSSPSMGIDVGYLILLPEGYRASEQRYPVVYYLHGGRPGNECKSHRLAEPIRTLMKGSGLMPVIYVFVNGGPVSHYNMPRDEKSQGASVFINELIPHVDRSYRTIADRSGRALEGFSQGGRGTMRLSLRHPDVFCSAAAGGGGYATEKRISESGGVESPNLRFGDGDNTWDLARSYAVRRNGPKVQWMIYVGSKGFNYENNLEYMDFLSSVGIDFERLVVPGVPHSVTGIYAKAAQRIMRFHVRNFQNAQSK
jgi:enterochelin esterase-like enzyme